MVLETHIKLYVTELDFPEKIVLNLLKNFVINFYKICSIMKIYIAVFLHKPHIWENFGFWDMGQNVLSQSDCMIFQSTIYPEQISEIA